MRGKGAVPPHSSPLTAARCSASANPRQSPSARTPGTPIIVFPLAFVDPPYESRVLDRILDMWRAKPFARILAVEHATSHAIPNGARRKVFGDCTVTIYKAANSEKRTANSEVRSEE